MYGLYTLGQQLPHSRRHVLVGKYSLWFGKVVVYTAKLGRLLCFTIIENHSLLEKPQHHGSLKPFWVRVKPWKNAMAVGKNKRLTKGGKKGGNLDHWNGSEVTCTKLIMTIWVFPKIGVPQNGWFIINGKPYQNSWFGGISLFVETPI